MIVKRLKALGCSVLDLSDVGNGCLDILVGYKGRNFLFEIKSEKGNLTFQQGMFFQTWSGNCYLVRSFKDCIDIFKSTFGEKFYVSK